MHRMLLFSLLAVFAPSGMAHAQDWIVYNPANSELPGSQIYSIAVDADGTIWIGTAGFGLVSYDGSTWSTYSTSNSELPGDYINALAIDGDGAVWIGTDTGLGRLIDGAWGNPNVPDDAIHSLAADGNHIWLGATSGSSGGLAHYDGSDWTTYPFVSSGLPDYVVQAVAVDGNGDAWIGTRAGLTHFDGSTWTTYNTANSALPDEDVHAVAIDESGARWIGTGGGVSRFDGTTWQHFDTSNSDLPSNLVGTIAVEGNGDVWFGTGSEFFGQAGAGLARFRAGEWVVYNTTNSDLPSNTVHSIFIDGDGNKWLATDEGVAAFNEGGLIGVYSEPEPELPVTAVLHANYPNPFNPTTTIPFTLRVPVHVTLTVHNALGQEVASIELGMRASGDHAVPLDATGLGSGTYVVRLHTRGEAGAERTQSRRIVLLK